MQKITPCLRFNNNAEEAVSFYTSLFQNSKIGKKTYYDEASAAVSGMPKDSLLTIDFELAGQSFMGLNGGPLFKFNPANSFFVNCETEEEIDQLRAKLSEGGQVMMPFDKYPFAEKFGWTSDRFGLSWQLMLSPTPAKHKIKSFLMFIENNAGKAEEAMNFYTTLFKNSAIEMVVHYEEGEGDVTGLVKHGKFSLDGSPFAILESTLGHKFNFNESVSYIVNCANQAEVDNFRNKLIADGGQESQCGRLKDKYGVSRQIVPTILNELLSSSDVAKSERVMKAMLEMKKLDVEALVRA